MSEFVEVKDWKAMGNKLSDQLLASVKATEAAATPKPVEQLQQTDLFGNVEEEPKPAGPKLKPGDTIEF